MSHSTSQDRRKRPAPEAIPTLPAARPFAPPAKAPNAAAHAPFGHRFSDVPVFPADTMSAPREATTDEEPLPTGIGAEVMPLQLQPDSGGASSAAPPPSPPAAPPESHAGRSGTGHFLGGYAIEAPPAAPLQRKPNDTGLPDGLKSGVEGLSGLALDDVQVYYNSEKPAGVGALAYAQGTDIHVGMGQEQHLPHEAWHVVQQKQGRVKPTLQAKGRPINDDGALEAEADVMGARALSTEMPGAGARETSAPADVSSGCGCSLCRGGTPHSRPLQRAASPGVIQRTLLNKGVVGQIENALSDILDENDAMTAPIAQALYEQIDDTTHDYNAKQFLEDAQAKTGEAAFGVIAAGITVGGPRGNYYPSSFNATARLNRDNYVASHMGSGKNAAFWKCPGNVKSHWADTNDVSIDHVTPVATHWNTVGYKSDKATRVAWYNDVTNHEILCRSCNSSKGSGGVSYTKAPDPMQGFSV